MRLDKSGKLLFAALATAAVLLGAFGARDRDIRKASAAINGEVYPRTDCEIAGDDFEGRSPGTKGEQLTVEFIEEQFGELGLQPVAGGSYRQDVKLVEITASAQQLSFHRGGGATNLAFGDDMVLATRRVQPASSIAGSAGRVRRLLASSRRRSAGTTTRASTCAARRR